MSSARHARRRDVHRNVRCERSCPADWRCPTTSGRTSARAGPSTGDNPVSVTIPDASGTANVSFRESSTRPEPRRSPSIRPSARRLPATSSAPATTNAFDDVHFSIASERVITDKHGVADGEGRVRTRPDHGSGRRFRRQRHRRRGAMCTARSSRTRSRSCSTTMPITAA